MDSAVCKALQIQDQDSAFSRIYFRFTYLPKVSWKSDSQPVHPK